VKVYDITLTCDHKILIAARTPGEAYLIALNEASPHGADPMGPPTEVALNQPSVLAWYPGPFSKDAILDEVPLT